MPLKKILSRLNWGCLLTTEKRGEEAGANTPERGILPDLGRGGNREKRALSLGGEITKSTTCRVTTGR